jgi:hypothetical protein
MFRPTELKALYEEGKNIDSLLRVDGGLQNMEQHIEISYDLQSGSYISGMDDETISAHIERKSKEITRIIESYIEPVSILEAGVGEATTYSSVLRNLTNTAINAFGFDLSWSRTSYAKMWLNQNGLYDVNLCTGSLNNIPFADDSIDIVYTSHAIEPNGGKEEIILKELFRVARRLLILLEPTYEFGNEDVRKRIDQNGYCKDLAGHAKRLGCNVVEHKLFPYIRTGNNPTAMTVILKEETQKETTNILACPRFKTPLQELGGMYFSPEALMVYPVLAGIPCLRIENGIVASKYDSIIASP